jgi:hypothetical protein
MSLNALLWVEHVAQREEINTHRILMGNLQEIDNLNTEKKMGG